MLPNKNKMQYKGKSWNWNWDKHCTKFHQQIQVNDAWVAAGLATRMSKEDKISSFLKTISMNCKNSELGIAWGIIKGNMSRFPTLIGTVIPHLSLCIELQEQGAPNAKHPIANTCSDSGWNSGKHHQNCQESTYEYREVVPQRQESGGDH